MAVVPFEQMNQEFKDSYRLKDAQQGLYVDIQTMPADAVVATKSFLIKNNLGALKDATSLFLRDVADGYLRQRTISFDEYNSIIVKGAAYVHQSDPNLMVVCYLSPEPVFTYQDKKFVKPHYLTRLSSWHIKNN